MYKCGDHVRTRQGILSGFLEDVIDTSVCRQGVAHTNGEDSPYRLWSEQFYLRVVVDRPLYARGTIQIVKLTEAKIRESKTDQRTTGYRTP